MTNEGDTPEEVTARHVEEDRVIIAAEVKAEGVRAAEDVEAIRSERAENVEVTRAELATVLETTRKQHNARVERRLAERTKVINRRFLFLFVALFLATGYLAYRSERNVAALENELLQQCLAVQQIQVSLSQPLEDCGS